MTFVERANGLAGRRLSLDAGRRIRIRFSVRGGHCGKGRKGQVGRRERARSCRTVRRRLSFRVPYLASFFFSAPNVDLPAISRLGSPENGQNF